MVKNSAAQLGRRTLFLTVFMSGFYRRRTEEGSLAIPIFVEKKDEADPREREVHETGPKCFVSSTQTGCATK